MFEEIFDKGKCWYVILVRMGKEQTIKQHILRSKSLNIEEILIPEITIKKTKEQEEEINSKHEALLGYVFLKLCLSVENYYQLLEIESVFRFLGAIKPLNSSTYKVYFPHKIPENQINNVKRFLNNEINEAEEIKSKYNIGDLVEIISGDLSSVNGKISHFSGNYVYITPQKFFTQTIKVPIKRITHCLS